MVEKRRAGIGVAGKALLAEATVLARCRHPGVVELRGVDTDGDEVAVTTAIPSGPRLHEARLSIEEMAGMTAVIATTVADLHDIGVAHCALSADSVIISHDGRAVVDGFSSARLLEGSPGRWANHPLSRADDRALGALLAGLLATEDAQLPSPDARRWPFRRRHRPGDAAASLAGWLAAAARGDVTSRRLAEAMAEDVPGARLPRAVADGFEDVGSPDLPLAADPSAADAPADRAAGPEVLADRPEPGPDAPDPWADPSETDAHVAHRPAALVPAAVGLAVVAGLAAAGALVSRPARHPSTAASPRTAATRSGVCLYPSGIPGCAVPVIAVGARRFRVGEPGDIVATGRWDCRATPTLAVLRPSSGTIWRFTDWPAVGTVGHPRPVAVVHGARTLGAAALGSCDTLVVGRDDGSRIDLGPWPAP